MPSWGFLGFLGLIGGGPTFVGTVIGQSWTSQAASVLFLALAGGSILYVVIELLNVLRGAGAKAMVTWGILFGLFLGFATDFVLVAAGGEVVVELVALDRFARRFSQIHRNVPLLFGGVRSLSKRNALKTVEVIVGVGGGKSHVTAS